MNAISTKCMMHAALAVTAVLGSPVLAQQAGTDPVKVYLMAGQSNMEGWGRWYENDGVTQHSTLVDPTDNYPLTQAEVNAYTTPLDQVWVAHPGTSRKATGPLEPGFGAAPSNGVNIGIELSMGHELAALNTNQFFFYKSDQGGTSLAADWRPPTAVEQRGGAIGGNYTAMIRGFHTLIDDFDRTYTDYDGQGFEVAGFVWLQGWNDQNASFAPEYEQNLVNLVHDVRADLGIADLPVIISDNPRDVSVQLHNDVATAKSNAVNTLNSELPGSAVYVDSLGVDPDGGGGWFHWNFAASNYIEMGKRNAAGAQSVMRSVAVNHEGDANIAAAWAQFRDNYNQIVRYKLDEAGGTTVLNMSSSGTVADAVLSNATARGSGLGGSAGAFNANEGVVRATNDYGNINSAYTLGAWIKLDGLADGNGTFTIMSTEDLDGSGSDTGWNLNVQRSQVDGQWVNYLAFDLRHRNGLNSLNDSDGVTDLLLEEGKEYFVAFARDVGLGSGNPDNSVFYLYDPLTDTLIASDGGGGDSQKATTFKNIRLGIGIDNYNVEQANTQFQGMIDDAQVWNLTLNEADILALARQGSLAAPIPEPTSLTLLVLGAHLMWHRRRTR